MRKHHLRLTSIFLVVFMICACASRHTTPTLSITSTLSATPSLTPTHSPTATPTLPPQAIDLGVLGKGSVNDIAWSPDGNLLAVASTTGVYFYDTKTWQVAGTIPKGKSARNWVNSLVFSPDGKGVVFSSYEIAFSPDGSLLVTNTSDKIQFWEVASGKLLRELDGA